MDILDREAINSLARPSGWPSVSLYMPTHHMPTATDQDRIRLKNLARQACATLEEQGLRDAEMLCRPLRELLDSDELWREVSRGLAAFISRDGMRFFRVDADMPEHIVVGDRFYLRPLLAAFRDEEAFFALALDKNGSRLFRADKTGWAPIDLASTPTTFEEAMKYEDGQKNLTHWSASPSSPSASTRQHGTGSYGGYGGEKDVANEQTARFLKLLERGVYSAIGSHNAPLVLLGVERLVSSYRNANNYARLAEEQVLGATDYLPDSEVVALARAALAPVFGARVQADLEELADREGSSLASRDVSEIVTAAATGRVKTLFFDDSAGPFGTFDRERMQVEEVCARSPRLTREGASQLSPPAECGWDLVDLAAAETALHSGRLLAFSGDDDRVRGVAALYRY